MLSQIQNSHLLDIVNHEEGNINIFWHKSRIFSMFALKCQNIAAYLYRLSTKKQVDLSVSCHLRGAV